MQETKMNVVKPATPPLSPDLIVDGGPVAVGVESTIVGCFDAPMLLRPGGVPRGEIERVLGRALVQPPEDADGDTGQPLAPGMLASHYAPRTRVRLNADTIEPKKGKLLRRRVLRGITSVGSILPVSMW